MPIVFDFDTEEWEVDGKVWYRGYVFHAIRGEVIFHTAWNTCEGLVMDQALAYLLKKETDGASDDSKAKRRCA